MAQILDENPTKFKVLVGGRTVAESISRTQAEIVVTNLSEGERSIAVIVPVTSNGSQVLLG